MNSRAKTFFISFLIIITISFFVFKSEEIEVYPNKDFTFETYTDSYIEGNSRIHVNNENDFLDIEYKLDNSILYPEVGLSFYLYKNDKHSFLNLLDFDYLKIKISSNKSRTALMLLSSPLTEFQNDETIYLIKEHPIKLWTNSKQYILNIEDFEIPDWWYHKFGFTKNDHLKINLTKINEIFLQFSNKENISSTNNIAISEIIAVKSRTKIFIFLYLFLLLVFFIFIVLNRSRIRINNNQENIEYKSLEVNNYSDLTTKKVIDYISTYYHDPEISVDSVSKNSNVSKLKVPLIIKTKFNLTFPQYVNKIRLIEAKRLLTVSDLNIIEIALKVGFNSATHFNRRFKDCFNVTPLQYRKDVKKK